MVTYVKLVRTLTPGLTSSNAGEIYDSQLGSVLLKLEAFDIDDEEIKLFVYQKEVETPEDQSLNNDVARFINVASPNDLEEIYEGIPLDVNIKLFRLGSIEVLCQSLEEATALYEAIQTDIRVLVDHNKLLMTSSSNVETLEFD